MNIHKNARLTLARRIEMVKSIVERGLTPAEAAAEAGVSRPTARKWLGRYLAHGEVGLVDRSSRPRVSPHSISPAKALVIVELRGEQGEGGVEVLARPVVAELGALHFDVGAPTSGK